MRGKKGDRSGFGKCAAVITNNGENFVLLFFFLAQQERFSLSDPQGLVKENKTI
jgi:hypothetical protein